jgi:hypothetical protein
MTQKEMISTRPVLLNILFVPFAPADPTSCAMTLIRSSLIQVPRHHFRMSLSLIRIDRAADTRPDITNLLTHEDTSRADIPGIAWTSVSIERETASRGYLNK